MLACPAAQGNCTDKIFRTHLGLREQVWFKLHRYHWLYLRNAEIRICCLLLIIKWFVVECEAGQTMPLGMWSLNNRFAPTYYLNKGLIWNPLKSMKGCSVDQTGRSRIRALHTVWALQLHLSWSTATKREALRAQANGWVEGDPETLRLDWGNGRSPRSRETDFSLISLRAPIVGSREAHGHSQWSVQQLLVATST